MVTLNTIDGYPLKTFSDLYGKSTDEKPLVKFDGYMIGNGSIFTEVDTGNIYMYDEENQRWYHQNGNNPPYPPEPEPETPDYLCFTCDGERALVSIKVMFEDLSFESTYEFIPNIEVSSDKITWRPFRFSWNDDIIELSDGESVYFRGTNDYLGWDIGEYGYQFYIDDDGSGALVKASGNIMSILDPTCESVTLNEQGGFPCLFYECTALSEAPDLPATTLSGGCYTAMFYGCTSLTSAPDLPATTLEGQCYGGMFSDCTSLVEGPDIAATALEWRSCYEMFRGCSNLEYVGVNFSEWSSNSDTYYWLEGVSETGTFMNNGNAEIPSRDTSGVPEGWTIIPEPPGYDYVLKDAEITTVYDGFEAYKASGIFTDKLVYDNHKYTVIFDGIEYPEVVSFVDGDTITIGNYDDISDTQPFTIVFWDMDEYGLDYYDYLSTEEGTHTLTIIDNGENT